MSSTIDCGISVTCPAFGSNPETTRSVSPHAASTSSRTVWSRESPTISEDEIIAEPIISPAISKAAWRFLRLSCCHAKRKPSKRREDRTACIPRRLKIPNMRPPTNPRMVEDPNHCRMKYVRIPSPTGAMMRRERPRNERSVRNPYAATNAPTRRMNARSKRRNTFTPPHLIPR